MRKKRGEGKKRYLKWKRGEAEEMEGTEVKRSGEVGQREKRPSGCYNGEGESEKGRSWNIKVF